MKGLVVRGREHYHPLLSSIHTVALSLVSSRGVAPAVALDEMSGWAVGRLALRRLPKGERRKSSGHRILLQRRPYYTTSTTAATTATTNDHDTTPPQRGIPPNPPRTSRMPRAYFFPEPLRAECHVSSGRVLRTAVLRSVCPELQCRAQEKTE